MSHEYIYLAIYAYPHYPAVFGGYLSDSLLKGYYAHKSALRRRFKVLPDRFVEGETRSKPIKTNYFSSEVLDELGERRRTHLDVVRKFRPATVHEWFVLWPATMRQAIPNHCCNRRLFASYEVFMSHEVLKVSASVPTDWKLNRKLFHKAFKDCLRQSKWVFHSDGRLPYFGSGVNDPLSFMFKAYYLANRAIFPKKTIGPWQNWRITKGEYIKEVEKSIDIAAPRLGLIKSDLSELGPESLKNTYQMISFLRRRFD